MAKKDEKSKVEEDEGKVRIKPDLDNYETVKSASGKKSQIRSGDPVAAGLVGMNLEQVYEVADDLGIEIPKGHYDHLNDGMQRMCIGNRIRGYISKKTKANEAAVAKKEKPGTDPSADFEKVIKPVRAEIERSAKAAEKAAKAA